MDKELYRPSRDGEGFLWDVLTKEGPLALEEIKKYLDKAPYNLDWGYVTDCLDFMIEDKAVIEEEGIFGIEPKLLEALRLHNLEEARKQIYYCEQCLHTRGDVVEMREVRTNGGDHRLRCYQCQGEWKLNFGTARHVVSLKLQHYRKLAEKLGILEIEEEATPCEICETFGMAQNKLVICDECYTDADMEREALKKYKERMKGLEEVRDADYYCGTCGHIPKVGLYCGTPCEEEKVYTPKDWITKQRKACGEE